MGSIPAVRKKKQIHDFKIGDVVESINHVRYNVVDLVSQEKVVIEAVVNGFGKFKINSRNLTLVERDGKEV